MENSWESATATIEEVRPVVASQAARGMLYRPEVLAHYKANGFGTKAVDFDRAAAGILKVCILSFRWKGQQCIVRWKASKPDQVVPELN